MVEAVRTPIAAGEPVPARRSLDERVFVRAPRLYALASRAVMFLPPRSRIRRALAGRGVRRGWAAWARLDLAVILLRYAPDCRVEPPRALLGAGMPRSYEGHRGLRELAADWREAWERMDVSPAEVLDAGDRIAVLGHSRVRARASGVELDSPQASVFWFERGLIVRHRDFTDWAEALDAAGISPARRPGV
jgi:uncharacterized protein